MFWRKPTITDPELGFLTFSYGAWDTARLETPAGSLMVSVAGSKDQPNPDCLAAAKLLVRSPGAVIAEAREYVVADANACEFMSGHGDLLLDGVAFLPGDGNFEVLFGLSGWDDASLVVCFASSRPYEVQLGD